MKKGSRKTNRASVIIIYGLKLFAKTLVNFLKTFRSLILKNRSTQSISPKIEKIRTNWNKKNSIYIKSTKKHHRKLLEMRMFKRVVEKNISKIVERI